MYTASRRSGRYLKRLPLALCALVIIQSGILPQAVLAYTSADFQPPPGGWLGTNTVNGGHFEPLNVVISARSDRAVKNDPRPYLEAVGFADCFGGQTVTANVDGTVQNQAFELREITGFGSCGETVLGGNHMRGFEQHPTGAWFLAVSEEHGGQGGPFDHHIDSNGFNKGRDDFVQQATGSVATDIVSGTRWRTTVEWVPGCQLYCGSSGAGNTDNVPYDGKVGIITVSVVGGPPPQPEPSPTPTPTPPPPVSNSFHAVWTGDSYDGAALSQITLNSQQVSDPIYVSFRNEGSSNWGSDVVLAEWDGTGDGPPVDDNRFCHAPGSDWLTCSPAIPAWMGSATIGQGQIGTFEFQIQAPQTGSAFDTTLFFRPAVKSGSGYRWIDALPGDGLPGNRTYEYFTVHVNAGCAHCQ